MRELIDFLLFCAVTWSISKGISVYLRVKGLGWFARHLVGWALGLFAGLLVLAFLVDDAVAARVIGWLLAIGIVVERWINRNNWAQPPPIPHPDGEQVRAEVDFHAPSTVVEHVANDPTEAIRRDSLAAMERAAKARKEDMAKRGEKLPTPIWLELPPQQVKAKTKRKTGRNDQHVDGTHLDLIQFDYLDSEENFTSRRLLVHAIDENYFNGIDTDKRQSRTFRIDRVVGRILSEDTGELMEPESWLKAMFAEHGIHDDLHWDAPSESLVDHSPEICFTGFPKAYRQQLEAMAKDSGMSVVKSVTVGLEVLCTGPNAGPAKLSAAKAVGARIVDVNEWLDSKNTDER